MPVMIGKSRGEVRTTIAISGSLTADDLSELGNVCDSVKGELSLHLAELLWVDDKAKKALQGLLAKGARLLSASPYIRLVLEQDE